MVLGIFKKVLRLRDRHVSNVFNTLSLKQIFWKMKTFFKTLEYRFLVEPTKIHEKLLCQKPMLKQIEWRLRNGPITNSGVLPVTT